jgi:hypothetical protein
MNNPVNDSEGLPSTRADTHVLRFTVKLPDVPAAELFCAEFQATPAAPGEPSALDRPINSFPTGNTVVYSRWAEIQYWLQLTPGPDVTPATANGPSLPLYSLRRRVRVLAPAGVTYVVANQQRAQTLINSYPDLAMFDAGPVPNGNGAEFLRVLGPDDVTNPAYRMPYQQQALKPNALGNMFPTGDDVLLTDVLSFEIKAAWFANPSFDAIRPTSSPNVRSMALQGNLEEPFDDLPQLAPAAQPPAGPLNPNYALQRVFDTWYLAPGLDGLDWGRPLMAAAGPGFLNQSPFQVPVRINVRALQIKLRIWDSRKEQARQVTIIQEI